MILFRCLFFFVNFLLLAGGIKTIVAIGPEKPSGISDGTMLQSWPCSPSLWNQRFVLLNDSSIRFFEDQSYCLDISNWDTENGGSDSKN